MLGTLRRMVWRAGVFAALGAASAAAADCTCRAMDRDFDLGTSICLRTPQGARLATCGMVLNNTSWKISSTPCLESHHRPLLSAFETAAAAPPVSRPLAVADR